jgi:serine acetyltransferase
MQAYSNLEIHYKADFKGGFMVLHASAGSVVSGLAIIGENLTHTRGNIIGGRTGCRLGELLKGDNCSLGANAVILGPIRLGNNIEV